MNCIVQHRSASSECASPPILLRVCIPLAFLLHTELFFFLTADFIYWWSDMVLKGIRICHLKVCHFSIRIIFSWRHLSCWNPLSASKQCLKSHHSFRRSLPSVMFYVQVNLKTNEFICLLSCLSVFCLLSLTYRLPRPFPIWNQSVVPCPILTVVSWPAYRFLKRQVRWSVMLT